MISVILFPRAPPFSFKKPATKRPRSEVSVTKSGNFCKKETNPQSASRD